MCGEGFSLKAFIVVTRGRPPFGFDVFSGSSGGNSCSWIIAGGTAAGSSLS